MSKRQKLQHSSDTRPCINEKATELHSKMRNLESLLDKFEDLSINFINYSNMMDVSSFMAYFQVWYDIYIALKDEFIFLETGRCTRQHHEVESAYTVIKSGMKYSYWSFDMINEQIKTK
jgi:NTP pyrophosphatase (non-canonical NTP hydrolase)